MKKSLSRSRRIVPWLFSALVVGLVAEPASARSKPPAAKTKRRIAVGAFSGPKSAEARSAVLDALKSEDEYDVSDASDVAADGDDQSYAKAGRALRVRAIITGTVKKGSTLVLSVHNGANGALIQDVELKGGTPAKLNKSITDSLIISVADVIAQGKPPKPKADDDDEKPAAADAESEDRPGKPQTKKPTGEDDEDDEKKPARASAGGSDEAAAGPSPFDVLVGIRGTRRSFWYKDTLDELHPYGRFPTPLTYLLPFGPAPFIDLTLYPFAFGSQRGFADDLGLIAGGEFGIPLKVVLDQGGTTQLTTSSHQFYAGVRDRIRTGHHELGIFAAFGQQAYSLNGNITPAPAFKDITYTFVKAGLDMRLVFGDVFVGAHAGSRITLGTGGLKKVFPNAKGLALDVGVSGGYSVSSHVDIVVGGDFLRYGLNFNPISPDTVEDGTPRVAGGAVDQYLSAWGGLRYHL